MLSNSIGTMSPYLFITAYLKQMVYNQISFHLKKVNSKSEF